VFGRATITLGIGPHSSLVFFARRFLSFNYSSSVLASGALSCRWLTVDGTLI